MSRIIAIDPGACTGYAVFQNKLLVAAGYVHLSKGKRPPQQDPETILVVEIPVIYPGARQEAPPNDIIRLALRAGWIKGFYLEQQQVEVTPLQWKGQTPKDISHRRILMCLSKAELQILENTKTKRTKNLNHNMLDAVGIGLWFVKRNYRGTT